MTVVKSRCVIGNAEITIKHETCSDAGGYRNKGIYLESECADKNTLTTLTFNDYLDIYVFWESFSSAASFDLLYVPETSVLFLGCGTLSARVSTTESRCIGLEHVFLFWSLDLHKNYVLETGELACFLYTLDGKQISKAEVDPPYEMTVTDQGIRFDSMVAGKTWLPYPKTRP